MTDCEASALEPLLRREQRRFHDQHPASSQAFEVGQRYYLYGAPSHWMRRWAGGFPLSIVSGQGARLRCADGLDYADFCLGDSGAMCGHAPEPVSAAVARQMSRGATTMMPGEDSAWVGTELARRFQLPFWGFTTSASDANRAAIRLARLVTGRSRVLVFNGCYHGSVEEAHVALQDGRVVLRSGVHANGVDHERVSRVVEFNDLPSLEAALLDADGDVACVLTEPVLTNFGMVLPQPGFHAALRELTRRAGALLIVDETHTFSSGPGGYGVRHGLEPDLLVLGKSIGGGIPVGLYGLSRAVAERVWQEVPKVNPALIRQSTHLGFGGTLAGSALQVAAVRAVLQQVLIAPAFDHMFAMAADLAQRARALLAARGRAWYVEQCGARVELLFMPEAPVNATAVARARSASLEALFHVYCLNRGIVITPFHCMLLMCPDTRKAELDRFIDVLGELCAELAALAPEGTGA